MKKKFISLLSIMLFIFSISLSAFASSNFNLRVFHGTDNISVLPPANNGDITIFVDSMTREQNGGIITDKGYVHFLPMIVVAQNYDLYFIAIDFFLFLNLILVKYFLKSEIICMKSVYLTIAINLMKSFKVMTKL